MDGFEYMWLLHFYRQPFYREFYQNFYGQYVLKNAIITLVRVNERKRQLTYLCLACCAEIWRFKRGILDILDNQEDGEEVREVDYE